MGCESMKPVHCRGTEWEKDEDRGTCKSLILDILREFVWTGFGGMSEALIVFEDSTTFSNENGQVDKVKKDK